MAEVSRKIIGELSFSLDDGIVGKYGKVFPGLFEDTASVSILRMDKTVLTVDKNILWSTVQHPNIIRFYAIEEDKLVDEFR